MLIACGVALALVWTVRAGRSEGVESGTVFDLAFVALVSGMLGARLFHVVADAPAYVAACFAPVGEPDCLAALRFWEGGLAWYGGLLGALGGSWLYCRRHALSYPRLADLFLPAVALGHAIGRIGCFFAGCCWGKPSSLPWAVRFPAPGPAWQQQVEQGLIPGSTAATLPVHPTQLYEAVGELAIFLLLLVLRRRRPRPGQVALAYCLLYALLRVPVEVFRGDEERGALVRWGSEALNSWLGLPAGSWVLLSSSQATSLAVAAAALGLLLWRRRTERQRA